MGAEILVRTLYVRADTGLDVVAAASAIEHLCHRAGVAEIRTLLNYDVIQPDPPTGGKAWSDHAITKSIGALRGMAVRTMFGLFDRFVESLTGPDVLCSRFSPLDVPGIDTYTTGGLGSVDAPPTGAFAAWDIVFDTDRFPASWPDTIGAAAGLLHPWGAGPVVATVTFRAWA